MIARIHQKLGTAGFVISIVALVVAMSGAAYAAKGALTGKQKKEVEKIAKKYAGKPGAPGAAGPAGPAGAAGPKGDTGAQGDKGEKGDPGKQGIQGVPGKDGETGFTETLPSGKTETGAFGYTTNLGPAQTARAPISFSIPLAASLAAGHVHLLTGDGSKEVVINESTEEFEAVSPTGCGSALNPPGTAASPRAAAGNLCVYVAVTKPAMVTTGFTGHLASNYITDPSLTCETEGCLPWFGGPGDGAGTSGAIIQVFQGGTNDTFYSGSGTWAVTAP